MEPSIMQDSYENAKKLTIGATAAAFAFFEFFTAFFLQAFAFNNWKREGQSKFLNRGVVRIGIVF